MSAQTWQRLDTFITLVHAFCIRRKLRAFKREQKQPTWADVIGPHPSLKVLDAEVRPCD